MRDLDYLIKSFEMYHENYMLAGLVLTYEQNIFDKNYKNKKKRKHKLNINLMLTL